MSKVKVIETDLYRDFKCDGTICPSTCCSSNWIIYVDKKTYEKYRTTKDKNLKEKFDKNIFRNRQEGNTNESYGVINRIPGNEYCPFLAEDKLCDIQRNLGEESLCNVCKTYPRSCIKFDDKFVEKTVDLSCPLVADMVVKKKDKLKIIESEEEVNLNSVVKKLDITTFPFAIDYLFDTKKECRVIMQREGYSIEERLILLCMFTIHIDSIMKDGVSEKKVQEYKQYRDLFNTTDFHEMLKDIKVNDELQFNALKAIMYTKTQTKISYELKDCLKELIDGFQVLTENNDKISDLEFEIYKHSLEEYYKPFLKEWELFFENYLVNKIVEVDFPFGNGPRYLKSTIKFICNYIFLKDVLIGVFANRKRAFDENELTEFIYKYERGTQHSLEHIDLLIKLIEVNKFDDVAHLAVVIKS